MHLSESTRHVLYLSVVCPSADTSPQRISFPPSSLTTPATISQPVTRAAVSSCSSATNRYAPTSPPHAQPSPPHATPPTTVPTDADLNAEEGMRVQILYRGALSIAVVLILERGAAFNTIYSSSRTSQSSTTSSRWRLRRRSTAFDGASARMLLTSC